MERYFVMRLALISTPRSGNTWVRKFLASALFLEQDAVHDWRDVSPPLPTRYILQVHWYREPQFLDWLNENGFTPVVIARHPLDVLISILRFAKYEPQTSRWLEGAGKLPVDLGQANPTSKRFLDWAVGPGAENLLSVSYAWWQDEAAFRLKYEDAIFNPEETFGRLLRAADPEFTPDGRASALLHKRIFEELQHAPNKHAWQGQPGLWKQVIASRDARRIGLRHQPVFDLLGYRAESWFVSRASARRRWDAVK